MIYKRKIIALVAGFFILTLIGALSSTLPIGINTVERMETNSSEFDSVLGMKLILTDQTMTFSSTRPKSYYSLSKFFKFNFMTNLILSFLILLLVHTISGLDNKKRFQSLLLVAIISIFSTHIPYWNWWGYSTSYTLGVSLFTILALVLTGLIISPIVLHKTKKDAID